MKNQERGDIYSRITTNIIAAIEAGAAEFRMPWHHDGSSTSRPINVASNKPYRGHQHAGAVGGRNPRRLQQRRLGNVPAMECQRRSGASR